MEPVATSSSSGDTGDYMASKEILRDGRGFTLVEMLVALVILSVSILALTSVTITSIKTNLDNDLRNTAIRLTTEAANDLFDDSFDTLVTGGEVRNVSLRGTSKAFTVAWVVTPQTINLKQIVVTVTYDLRGVSKTNTAVFYRPRAV